MSSEMQFGELAEQRSDYHQYRALCTASVSSLLFGLLSVLGFLSPFLMLIPILGILMGLYALAQIRQRPDELAGRGLALTGALLSAILFACSAAYTTFVYMTEVPEGYRRIYYVQLQPEEGQVGQIVPPLVEQLDGEKVFIKGYIFPGKQQRGIKTFLLVRDKGDCCFGGNPKLTDRIQVTLSDPQRLIFSSRLHKLAGTFRLKHKPSTAVDAGGDVYYYLEDSQLR